jgi:hypothetical protein
MTKKEFMALRDHARIKYTGSDPESLYKERHSPKCTLGKKVKDTGWGSKGKMIDGWCDGCYKQKMPGKFKTKGVIVSSIWGGDSYSKGKVSLNYYGGTLEDIDPSEWSLEDERKWVEKETEFKYTRSGLIRSISDFKIRLTSLLVDYNEENGLDRLPLDKKLKIIMDLDPEQKKWFGIMSTPPDQTLKTIEKAFEGEDDPT